MRKCNRPGPNERKGNIVVLTAFMMVAMMGMLAVAIDIGYLQMAQVQLQESADAAALAGVAELIDNDVLKGTPNMSGEIQNARAMAVQYAAYNKVCGTAPIVNSNTNNSSNGGIVVGYLSDLSNRSQTMDFTNSNQYNAVQVTVQRSQSENGVVPFFFSRAWGVDGIATKATATAAIMNNISGFQTPANGGNLGMLPFALDKQTWDGMLAGGGSDTWNWNDTTKQLTSGSDGIREVNLYPQGTGAPGNRGTVDIGSSNNSTADIARQILNGVSPSDLAIMGGRLQFDSNGDIFLNGDTGISAGVKDELASIKGQPRIIPIFSSVSGPGNNATYTIVAFAGVRILDVVLTGPMSSKRVIIQPANVSTWGGIPSSGAQTTYYVHSPVWLVR